MRYLAFILAILPIAAQAFDNSPSSRLKRQACPAADRCGSACCSQDGFFTYFCANAARNLCCETGEREVSGKCCPQGAPQRTIVCGGQCCVGTCNSQRCQTDITDRECQALNSAGACATTPRGRSCGSCNSIGCCVQQIF